MARIQRFASDSKSRCRAAVSSRQVHLQSSTLNSLRSFCVRQQAVTGDAGGKDLTLLNGYSSAIMVLGPKKGRALRRQLGVVVAAGHDVSILSSTGRFKLVD